MVMIKTRLKGNVKVKRGDFIKARKGIATVMRTVGFGASAKSINRLTNPKDIEKEVFFHIDRELKTGRGSLFLINPTTRKKSRNPLRNNWVKLKKGLIVALKILKSAKKLEKAKRKR